MSRITSVVSAFVFLSAAVFAQQRPPNSDKPTAEVPDIMGRATLLIKPSPSGDLLIDLDGKSATLRIVVDKNGDVVSAKCSLTCPRAAVVWAERAAASSKFRSLIINGQAVTYSGTLTYTFAVERVNWYQFGNALYSVLIFDNLSLGTVADILTSEFGTEKAQLQELNSNRDLQLRWKTIGNIRDSLRVKLSERDRWEFDLGMAARTITAPFQSDRKLVRDEIQKALADLKKFADTAPAEARGETVQAIRTASEFTISPEMTNRELAAELYKLVILINPNPPTRRPPVRHAN